jgi:hypothetical protein
MQSLRDTITDQAPLFKFRLVSKTLEPPKVNLEVIRTITIKFLMPGY